MSINIIVDIMQSKQDHLLQLVEAKENQAFQEVKKRLSDQSKYFFNVRRNITIVYDKPNLYVIHKEYLKIIEFKKPFNIINLAYNYKKNVVLFMTLEAQFFIYFASTKSLMQIKKDFKKVFMLEWLYSVQQVAHFFVAQAGGIHLYKIYEQEKRTIKEVKHISGKFICYLYEPLSQILVGFQYGECQVALIYDFQMQKAKNWFRSGQIQVNFSDDQVLAQRIKLKKTLGFEGNRISKQLFPSSKSNNRLSDESLIDIQCLHNVPYLFFYNSSEGKLQLTPLVQSSERKRLMIKLPSESPPSFNVYDNMLVVHLKNEKITFIYQINPSNFQPLVSPYPLTHEIRELSERIYTNQFISKRSLLPSGHISKWRIFLPSIYHYLKGEMQIFQFLNRRANSKIEAIRWMRENLFKFKQTDLSKMWKSIFLKIQSRNFDESEIISMVEIYTNLFYTLSIEPLVDKLMLTNTLIQCLRQASQYQIWIPNELQMLTAQLLLVTGQHELLTYICYNGIIRNDEKISLLIYEYGEKEESDLLLTLSLDIACQCSSPKIILTFIMKSQRPRQAKRFIKSNFEKMEATDMLQATKHLKDPQIRHQFTQYLKYFITKKKLVVDRNHLNQITKKVLQ